MSQQNVFWVGVSPSDINGVEHLFSGVIALLGSNDGRFNVFHSLEDNIGRRVNHNDPKNFEICDDFLIAKIREISKDHPTASFLWQDQQSFSIEQELLPRTFANNRLSLTRFLSNKIILRNVISRFASTVPGITALKSECSYKNFRKLMPACQSYVIQESHGAGGYNTIIIRCDEDDDRIARLKSDIMIVTGYLDKAVPINQHLMVFEDKVKLLPPSVQIVSPSEEGAILYKGGDFSAAHMVSEKGDKALQKASKKIGELLQANGYRGVAGIDYLMDGDEPYFIEINPRFQASTRLLNANLLQQGLPSVHEMHLMAFHEETPRLPNNISATGAFLLGLNDGENTPLYADSDTHFSTPDKRETPFAQDQIQIRILTEKLSPSTAVEPYAKLWRLETDHQIARYDHAQGVTVDHAIWSYLHNDRPRVGAVSREDVESLARLKFALFAHGLRITEPALKQLANDRDDLTIRDGIAGGLEIKIFDSIHVNVPIKEYFAFLSPLSLDWSDHDGFVIRDDRDDFIPIEILPIPDFAGNNVSSGTPMLDIGQMFNERLSIEIFFGCVNTWANKTACHFCELGAERKPQFVDLDDTQELVAHCRDNSKINMRHILLGGGTPADRMLHLYVEAAKRVRKETDIPLYIMMAPPPDLNLLKDLKDAGVNEIGFNIEVYDRVLAQKIMPAKGKIPLEKYFETMDYAVNLWGATGAVRSILIIGLEPLENTLKGVHELCKRGVMPILSPFRPIPGTPLSDHPTPTPELLYQSWKQSEEIAQEYGLCLGPTCVACQNNTITMPADDFHKYY